MRAPDAAEQASGIADDLEVRRSGFSNARRRISRGDPLSQPIHDDEFAAWMAGLGPFERSPRLAIAVSGGADSLALTLLADRWARALGGRVVGLTVDHGLREGSSDEARQIGRWLAERRIEHHCLPWMGEKPESGIQHRARTARYRLLNDWCREEGCLHLLLAHHRLDQAETVQIRRDRQSGDAGLAGMSPIREISGLRLLRPLLGVEKARLTESLKMMGQPWIDDPSNRNPAFARTHLRRESLDDDGLLALADKKGRRRQQRDFQVAKALVNHVVIDPAGFIKLDAEGFSRLPRDLARDLLMRALMTIGGRAYPPRGDSLSRLLDDLRHSSPPETRTLAHCLILKRRDCCLIIPEKASTDITPLRPGSWRRFDDRFKLRLASKRPGLCLGSLGNAGRQAKNALLQKGPQRRLPALIRRTLPSLWEDGVFAECQRLVAIPHLGLFDQGMTPEDVDLRFCPRIALAQAAFTPHMTP